MILIEILIVAIFALAAKPKCRAELHTESEHPSIVPTYPNCNEGVSDSLDKALDSGLRFRLPVLDTVIHNDKKMHVLQESEKQRIFILHDHDLYQMFISREKKTIGLVGRLDNSLWQKESLGAELISWRNNLLLVVAFDTNLVVYKISEEIMATRAQIVPNPNNKKVPTLEPLQELTMPGKFRKMFLAEPAEHTIMLILAVDNNDGSGHLKTFRWMNTYFDPVEELTVPALNVLSQSNNYLMVGRTVRDKLETILTVYEIIVPSMKLKSRQTLTANSRTLHFMNFRQQYFFIACSKEQIICNTFKMIDGQYAAWRQRSSKDLAFSHFVAGQYFLMGVRDDEVMVVPNTRLDCYSSFISKDTDINAIMTHVNEHGENFILLTYVRPTQTVVRVVEIEDESGEVLSSRAAEKDDVAGTFAQKSNFIEKNEL